MRRGVVCALWEKIDGGRDGEMERDNKIMFVCLCVGV